MNTRIRLTEALFSPAIVLAAITGLGYLYAFLFEVGFLSYFGIPYQMAHVTTESFIIVSIILLVTLLTLLPHIATWKLLWAPMMTRNHMAFIMLKHVQLCMWLFLTFLPVAVYYNFDIRLFIVYLSVLYVIRTGPDLIYWRLRVGHNLLLCKVRMSTLAKSKSLLMF